MTTDAQSLETLNVADLYTDWAAAILSYRKINFNALTEFTRKNLLDSAMTLLDKADEQNTDDATEISEDVRMAFDRTIEVTVEIKKSYNTLTDIEKGIAVAGCVVALGQTLITRNPSDINNALNDLLDKWNA